MSYPIDRKVYTDHPLMDEMIVNLNQITASIVLKDEARALANESKVALDESAWFMAIMNNTAHFNTFPFTREMLAGFGYKPNQIIQFLDDREKIPRVDRERLMRYAGEYYIEHYEEKNNYYRMLNGLPSYESGNRYFVYIDESYIDDPECKDLIDFSLPVHQYNQYQISILDIFGVIDRLVNEYPGRNYSYLRFLGDRNISVYKARQAAKWDILYIPSVEHMVLSRYKEIFTINRDNFLQRSYTLAYKYMSDYYEEFCMLMLVCQTYADMILDVPEYYIRRDIFDIRTCQYFLESQGVQFFKQIPLKYQVTLVRNINKLIRYKSTNRSIWDIIDIFDIENTVMYKYYLLKKRRIAFTGEYIVDNDGDPEKEFELEFVKTPIGDTYDNTIKDNIYRTPYDDITYADKYWDGEDTHDYVRKCHYAKDFTIEGTKYMSIDLTVSMQEYQFQLVYFIGLLMDSNIDTDDINISLPFISPRVTFRLSDLFLLLFCLTGVFEGYYNKVFLPDDPPTDPKPEFEKYKVFDGGGADLDPDDVDGGYIGGDASTDGRFCEPFNGGWKAEYTEIVEGETYYDWMRKKYPYFWIDLSGKILGFNMKANLDELAELVGVRHSTFGFRRGYTLEELGVAGFDNRAEINTIEDLMQVYRANKECYDTLYDLIVNAETRDDMIVYQFVMNYLFTRDFDYKVITLNDGSIADTFDEVLKNRNIILFQYYRKVISEPDLEAKQDMIRQAMNDIVATLEYYVNDPALKYVFAFASVSSLDSLLKYLYMVINFFKSYKVYFLDPIVTYVMDDKMENTVFMKDMLVEKKLNYDKEDIVSYQDRVTAIEYIDLTDWYAKDQMVETLEILPIYTPIFGQNLYMDGKSFLPHYNAFDIDGGPPEDQDFYMDANGMDPDTDDVDDFMKMTCVNIDGGDPDFDVIPISNGDDCLEEADPEQDFDGGDAGYFPYYQMNGGYEGIGMNMDDLDGGGAIEMDYYMTIDGRGADADRKTKDPNDYYAYEVHCGYADNSNYRTNSINVQIVDNALLLHVLLGMNTRKAYNLLTIEEDGLALLLDRILHDDSHKEFSTEALSTMKDFENKFSTFINKMTSLGNPRNIEELIRNGLNTYFESAQIIDRGINQQTFQKWIDDYNEKKKKEFEKSFDKSILTQWAEF